MGIIQSIVKSTMYSILIIPWVTNSKIYSSINSSKLVEENKDRKVGKNDFLWDTHALEGMFLNATQQVDLGNDAHIANNLFEIIGYTSTTPLFGYGLRYTD